MKHIQLAHGAGGEIMQGFIRNTVLKYLKNPPDIQVPLDALDDSAVINDIVFTTDSHTVKPLFFPGGDIGSLSVSGTVNDLSVMGAKPIALSLGLIIEEGFLMDDLDRIFESIGRTSEKAGVPIITGDTKTVAKGALDGLMTNTSGIGVHTKLLERNIQVVKDHREFDERWLRDSNLALGDSIIISGYIGDHGIALLSFREGYGFESEVKSDICPLNKMIENALEVGGIVSMKDPTRGGLANALNEWAEKSKVGIVVEEEQVPIRESVQAACDMLGIDAFNIGNEGKVIIGVVKEEAEDVLNALRKTEEGRDAQIIGKVTKDVTGVALRTLVGGLKIMDSPAGDPIPRIC